MDKITPVKCGKRLGNITPVRTSRSSAKRLDCKLTPQKLPLQTVLCDKTGDIITIHIPSQPTTAKINIPVSVECENAFICNVEVQTRLSITNKLPVQVRYIKRHLFLYNTENH